MDDDLIGCFLAIVALLLFPLYALAVVILVTVETLVDVIRWLIERNRR